jgi:hypothetical protein
MGWQGLLLQENPENDPLLAGTTQKISAPNRPKALEPGGHPTAKRNLGHEKKLSA